MQHVSSRGLPVKQSKNKHEYTVVNQLIFRWSKRLVKNFGCLRIDY